MPDRLGRSRWTDSNPIGSRGGRVAARFGTGDAVEVIDLPSVPSFVAAAAN